MYIYCILLAFSSHVQYIETRGEGKLGSITEWGCALCRILNFIQITERAKNSGEVDGV